MSRIAVVSRTRNEIDAAGANLFDPPELLTSFGSDDESMARAYARTEARNRLNELIDQEKGARCDLELPWLEEIIVCPILSGTGRGGLDYYETGNASLRITVGVE